MVKKDIMLFAFVLALLLLLGQSVIAADKPPTLEYGIIKNNNKAPPSMSTHPPPANYPTRGCNAENYCRHFTLSVVKPSGTPVEAVAAVYVGAPLNSSAPGTEAIAAAIAKWALNITNGNSSTMLSISMNSTAGAGSAEKLHLQAFYQGIVRMGLHVPSRYATMPKEDTASLPIGEVTLKVNAASTHVDLKFLTRVKSFGETDIIQILEFAKSNITNYS